MAKKKNINKKDLISMYMDYVLNHDHDPKSVYLFCKENNFDEPLFYQHYASFEQLKKDIFSAFFENTTALLHKSEDFQSYDAREKLLSFYFTFFEILTANRSYVVYALSKNTSKLKTLRSLQGLETHFKHFVDELEIETLDLKQEQLEKIKDKALLQSAWMQLLITLKFWLDDTSPSFEKTDVFIEKAVHASFDVLDIIPVKSVIDLGKFLFKEKVMNKA